MLALPVLFAALILCLCISLGLVGYFSVGNRLDELSVLVRTLLSAAGATGVRQRSGDGWVELTIQPADSRTFRSRGWLISVDAGDVAPTTPNRIVVPDGQSPIRVRINLVNPGSGAIPIGMSLYDMDTLEPVGYVRAEIPAVPKPSILLRLVELVMRIVGRGRGRVQ